MIRNLRIYVVIRNLKSYIVKRNLRSYRIACSLLCIVQSEGGHHVGIVQIAEYDAITHLAR